MTTDTTGHAPATKSDEQKAFDDQARFDLENTLTKIFGLAHVIMALGQVPSGDVEQDELAYLGGQLIDHQRAADDAFNRIFKLSEYRVEEPVPEDDPTTALGAADLPALVAERMKIWAIAERSTGEKKLTKLGEQYGALDNRIADIVAPSLEGVLAQVELLIAMTEDEGAATVWSDNRDRRLKAAIKAGLRNLSAGEGGAK